MSEPIAELKDIHHSFDTTALLDGITHSFYPGTLSILYGESGSGKSTLLKILAGDLQPDSGILHLAGESQRQRLPASFPRVHMITAHTKLFDDLSLQEHLQMQAEWMGYSVKDFWIEESMDVLNLKEHMQKPVRLLSDGQYQKAVFLLAIASQPLLLLGDEIFCFLDEKSQKKLFQLLRTCMERYGTTVILASHTPSIARSGDVLLELRKGKLFCVRKN